MGVSRHDPALAIASPTATLPRAPRMRRFGRARQGKKICPREAGFQSSARLPGAAAGKWATPSAQDLRVDVLQRVLRDHVEAGDAGGLEGAAGVSAGDRVLDDDRAGVVVAHEEDGAAAFV